MIKRQALPFRKPGKSFVRPLHRRWAAGIATVWTALISLVIFGLLGLALDFARVHLVAHQLQAASEASSLAATRLVRGEPAVARLAAINTAKANVAGGSDVDLIDNPDNDPAGDIVLGRWDRDTRTFAPTLTSPNAVKVVARRTEGSVDGQVPLIFGPLFAKTMAQVERTTIAMISGGTGAGLICLDPDREASLYFQGNAVLNVDGGPIQVNSTDNKAVDSNGNAHTILAPAINVCGGMDKNVNYNGEYNPDSPPILDPLEFLQEYEPLLKSQMTDPAYQRSAEDSNLTPGYYPLGLSMLNGSKTLAPGIYVLGGEGLQLNGGSIYAHGVMFYIASGTTRISANTYIDLTSPDPEDPALNYSTDQQDLAYKFEGVSIFQASDNSAKADFWGGAGTDIEGALYFPEAIVEVHGTPNSLGTMLVADSVWLAGDANVTINYDGRFAAQGDDVFIVW